MSTVEGKPLQPLSSGIVLIAGVKSSNFDEEIKNHPRVVLWDSQNEHWHSKSLPDNTRVVFVTRFIAHAPFHNIMSEARKRQLTIFNPEGTGMIAKQVRELLAIPAKVKDSVEVVKKKHTPPPVSTWGKLEPLMSLADFSKTNIENARFMMIRAREMGIETTEGSLAVGVANRRRKLNQTGIPKSIRPKVDVSVEILDNLIKELSEVRKYLIATTNENSTLRTRIEKFKKMLED